MIDINIRNNTNANTVYMHTSNVINDISTLQQQCHIYEKLLFLCAICSLGKLEPTLVDIT